MESYLDLSDFPQYCWIPAPAKSPQPFLKVRVKSHTQSCFTYETFSPPSTHEVALSQMLAHNPFEDVQTTNLLDLKYSNPAEILHFLERRFRAEEIQTNLGDSLLILNPQKPVEKQYSEEIMRVFCQKLKTAISERNFEDFKDAHIFSRSAEAYFSLFVSQRNQAILIQGIAGSGKTENAKLALRFLAGFNNSEIASTSIAEKIISTIPILESFGNARTLTNPNSSRFGKFIRVLIEKAGVRIQGAAISSYLLEKSRVSSKIETERNYHIFYEVLAGLGPEEKTRFLLEKEASFKDFKYLRLKENMDASGTEGSNYQRLLASLKTIDFSEEEFTAVLSIVISILFLGNLEFKDSGQQDRPCTDLTPDLTSKIAQLLQLNRSNLLENLLFKTRNFDKEMIKSPLNRVEILALRDSLARGMYDQLFNWLMKRLNLTIIPKSELNESLPLRKSLQFLHKSLKNPSCDKLAIGLLDIFGFEDVPWNGFEQFCINFLSEKLHQMYLCETFQLELKILTEEGLLEACGHVEYRDNQTLLDLFEKYPLGLFQLLDESSTLASNDDKKLLDHMIKVHKDHPNFLKPKAAIDRFSINHTGNHVQYHIAGFRSKNKDEIPKELQDTIEESENVLISNIFKGFCGFEVGKLLDYKKKFKENQGDAAKKKAEKFLGAKFRAEIQQLIEELNTYDCSFVRCLKPNNGNTPGVFDHNFVYGQLNGMEVFETVKLRKEGFFFKRKVSDFVRHFKGISIKPIEKIAGEDEKLRFLLRDIPENLYFIGKTRVFMRYEGFKRLQRQLKERMQVSARVILKGILNLRVKRKGGKVRDFEGRIRKLQRLWREKKGLNKGEQKEEVRFKALEEIKEEDEKPMVKVEEKPDCKKCENLENPPERLQKIQEIRVFEVSEIPQKSNEIRKIEGDEKNIETPQKSPQDLPEGENPNYSPKFLSEVAIPENKEILEAFKITPSPVIDNPENTEKIPQLPLLTFSPCPEILEKSPDFLQELMEEELLVRRLPSTSHSSSKIPHFLPAIPEHDESFQRLEKPVRKERKLDLQRSFTQREREEINPRQRQSEQEDLKKIQSQTMIFKKGHSSMPLNSTRLGSKTTDLKLEAEMQKISLEKSLRKSSLLSPRKPFEEYKVSETLTEAINEFLAEEDLIEDSIQTSRDCLDIYNVSGGPPPSKSLSFPEYTPDFDKDTSFLDLFLTMTSSKYRLNINSFPFCSDLNTDINSLSPEFLKTVISNPFQPFVEKYLPKRTTWRGKPIPFHESLSFSPKPKLSYPLTPVSKHNEKLSQRTFKLIVGFMQEKNEDKALSIALELLETVFSAPEREELKNEVFLQIIKQTRRTPDENMETKAFMILCIFSSFFKPADVFLFPVLQQLYTGVQTNQKTNESQIPRALTRACFMRILRVYVTGERKKLPSIKELKIISRVKKIVVQIGLPNNWDRFISVPIEPHTTVLEAKEVVLKFLNLEKNSWFFGLFSVINRNGEIEEVFLDDQDKYMDLLNELEAQKDDFEKRVQLGKNKGFNKLWFFDYRIVLKIRLFFKLWENDTDGLNFYYLQHQGDFINGKFPLLSETEVILLATFSLLIAYDFKLDNPLEVKVLSRLLPKNPAKPFNHNHILAYVRVRIEEFKELSKKELKLLFLDVLRKCDGFMSHSFLILHRAVSAANGKEVTRGHSKLMIRPLQLIFVDEITNKTTKVYRFEEIKDWGMNQGIFIINTEDDLQHVCETSQGKWIEFLLDRYGKMALGKD